MEYTITPRVPGVRPQDPPDYDGITFVYVFTQVLDPWTMPPPNQEVTLVVANAQGFTAGMTVFIENAGYFEVVSTTVLDRMTVISLGTAYTVPPGTGILPGKITTTSLPGPAGSEGPVGPPGPQGPPGTGSGMLDGTGPPPDSLGVVGDYYVDVSGQYLYGPKAATGVGAPRFATDSSDAPTANTSGMYCYGNHFKMLVAGQITGARYYHQSGTDVNPRKLSIWNASTHALLGQTALTTENAGSSGWLYAALPTPIPFNANDEFVVSYDNTTGGTLGYKSTGGAVVGDASQVAFVEACYIAGFGAFPSVSAGAISVLTDLEYKPPGASVWPVAVPGMEEAPTDGQQYARKNAGWSVVTGGAPSALQMVWGETPGGAINGVNKNYTSAYAYRPNLLGVFLNGLRQRRTDDYTETGSQSFSFVTAPLSGDSLSIDYIQP